MRIGILTISDRAADGRYQDQGGPAIEAWLARVEWVNFSGADFGS